MGKYLSKAQEILFSKDIVFEVRYTVIDKNIIWQKNQFVGKKPSLFINFKLNIDKKINTFTVANNVMSIAFILMTTTNSVYFGWLAV